MSFYTAYKKSAYGLLLIFVILCQGLVTAQFRQDTSKAVQYLLIPVFFKTPENGFSYGVSGSMSFNTARRLDSVSRHRTRTSVIQVLGFLTTRRQNVQVIDASIYFPKEKYIFLGQISHSYFPDRFWGIGPDTKNEDVEHYLYEQVFVTPHIKRKIGRNFFAGLLYEFQTVYNIHYEPGGLFEKGDFYGKQDYIVSGLGLSLAYDTRDISFWPSKGFYMQTQVIDFGKQFFSDYTLAKWVTDLRYFKKIVKGQILAMQFYNYQTFGDTPLRELASFGGPGNMRGFYQGRFRADNMVSFIAEYRMHVYGRFSAVAFGGAGDIYNKYSELKVKNIKYSWGGGIRFALLEQEKLHIRVDYGYSDKYNRGLYVTVGECF